MLKTNKIVLNNIIKKNYTKHFAMISGGLTTTDAWLRQEKVFFRIK